MREHIEKGTFCPLTAMRQPNVDLDTYVAKEEYVKAKLAVAQLKHNAYPAKLLTEVNWTCMFPKTSQMIVQYQWKLRS